jgi:hypothetical protein
MKFLLIIAAVVIASASASSILNAELSAQWESYKQEHNKVYEKAEEETAR